MPVARDSRYECACCGAEVVYRTECPREDVDRPVCVCGDRMEPMAAAGGRQKD